MPTTHLRTADGDAGLRRRAPGNGVPGPYTRQVGPWRLVGLVGDGALSRVYRARPVGSSDAAEGYALKMLRPHWQDDPRGVEMLRREARVGRSVSNPHLVPVLRHHLARTPRYLVMPCLRGTTLSALTASGYRFDVPVTLSIARQTAEGLAALHAAGWRHGDVKPQNLFISPEGHVTLLDLGFARSFWEREDVGARCVTGTCRYFAPELTSTAHRPDARADIYSLGIVLFELLAGRPPFDAEEMTELARLHREARPKPLSELRPMLPRAVVGLVHRMIAKSPLRRPRTARELVDLLARLEIETFSERALRWA
jgi:eukaryotic-like serine/threonine-protein kinase